jgi:hypothetical protein
MMLPSIFANGGLKIAAVNRLDPIDLVFGQRGELPFARAPTSSPVLRQELSQ